MLPPKKTQEGIRHIFLPGGASAADFVGPSRQGSDGGEKEIRLHPPARLLLGHRGELDGTASEEKERGYSPSLSAVLRPAVQSTGGGDQGGDRLLLDLLTSVRLFDLRSTHIVKVKNERSLSMIEKRAQLPNSSNFRIRSFVVRDK